MTTNLITLIDRTLRSNISHSEKLKQSYRPTVNHYMWQLPIDEENKMNFSLDCYLEPEKLPSIIFQQKKQTWEHYRVNTKQPIFHSLYGNEEIYTNSSREVLNFALKNLKRKK